MQQYAYRIPFDLCIAIAPLRQNERMTDRPQRAKMPSAFYPIYFR